MSSIKFAAGQEEVLKAAETMYNFVLNSQTKYCKMDTKHPFLMKTYQNVAVFYRTIKNYQESLLMWKRLEILQKELYGDKCV